MRILKQALPFTAYAAVIVCLSACSSKDGVTSLQQDKTNWYCTPSPSSGELSSLLNNDGWRCQESAEAYNDLAPKPQPEVLVSTEQVSAEQVSAEQVSAEQVSAEQVVVDSSTYDLSVTDVKAEPVVVTESRVDEPTVVSDIKDENYTTQVKEPPVNETVNKVAQETVSPELTATSSPNDDFSEVSNWVVQLAAYTEESRAQALVDKLVTSEYVKTQVDNKEFFTVVVLGFEQRYEAESTASLIKNRHSTLTPWIRSGESFRKILAE